MQFTLFITLFCKSVQPWNWILLLLWVWKNQCSYLWLKFTQDRPPLLTIPVTLNSICVSLISTLCFTFKICSILFKLHILGFRKTVDLSVKPKILNYWSRMTTVQKGFNFVKSLFWGFPPFWTSEFKPQYWVTESWVKPLTWEFNSASFNENAILFKTKLGLHSDKWYMYVSLFSLFNNTKIERFLCFNFRNFST